MSHELQRLSDFHENTFQLFVVSSDFLHECKSMLASSYFPKKLLIFQVANLRLLCNLDTGSACSTLQPWSEAVVDVGSGRLEQTQRFWKKKHGHAKGKQSSKTLSSNNHCFGASCNEFAGIFQTWQCLQWIEVAKRVRTRCGTWNSLIALQWNEWICRSEKCNLFLLFVLSIFVQTTSPITRCFLHAHGEFPMGFGLNAGWCPHVSA